MENLSYGHTYNLQIAQVEKAFCELKELVTMNYDPYSKMKEMVECFIAEFKSELC